MKCIQSVHVVADDRERKSGIIEQLEQKDHVQVDIQRLSVGDYLINHRILCERKSLKDFTLSIVDGRLFKQAHSLVNADYASCILLEGRGRDLAESKMNHKAIQGAIVTLSFVFGIPVLRSGTAEESADLLIMIGFQMQKYKMMTPFRYGRQPRTRKKQQLFILEGLPGVGAKKAKQLLDHFGSIRSIVNATSEDVQRLPGFGSGTAGKIYEAVHDQNVRYG